MGHNLLQGKRGIIFGALNDMSIAWKVAEKAVEEGAVGADLGATTFIKSSGGDIYPGCLIREIND